MKLGAASDECGASRSLGSLLVNSALLIPSGDKSKRLSPLCLHFPACEVTQRSSSVGLGLVLKGSVREGGEGNAECYIKSGSQLSCRGVFTPVAAEERAGCNI